MKILFIASTRNTLPMRGYAKKQLRITAIKALGIEIINESKQVRCWRKFPGWAKPACTILSGGQKPCMIRQLSNSFGGITHGKFFITGGAPPCPHPAVMRLNRRRGKTRTKWIDCIVEGNIEKVICSCRSKWKETFAAQN